jgi:hypothetical protein
VLGNFNDEESTATFIESCPEDILKNKVIQNITDGEIALFKNKYFKLLTILII